MGKALGSKGAGQYSGEYKNQVVFHTHQRFFEKMEENTLTAPRLAGLHEKNIPVAA